MFWRYLSATWAFLAGFLKPTDLVDKWCEKGHTLLSNWDFCPDCQWIKSFQSEMAEPTPDHVLALLFCIQGTHQGELFCLVKNETSLGASITDSIVLSVPSDQLGERYKVILTGGNALLVSESSQGFLIGDRSSWKEELFDYDEVEFLSNRFLFFDLQPYLRTETVRHPFEEVSL